MFQCDIREGVQKNIFRTLNCGWVIKLNIENLGKRLHQRGLRVCNSYRHKAGLSENSVVFSSHLCLLLVFASLCWAHLPCLANWLSSSSSPAELPASCLLGQEGRQGGRQTLPYLTLFLWQYNNATTIQCWLQTLYHSIRQLCTTKPIQVHSTTIHKDPVLLTIQWNRTMHPLFFHSSHSIIPSAESLPLPLPLPFFASLLPDS